MTKQKTKVIPFDTTATELKPDVWTWQIGNIKWYWRKRRGLNCGMIVDNVYVPMVFVNTIDQAGCFSQGYEAGRELPPA